MALPKREARIAQLIRRGFQPSVAERIVADCERADQRIIPAAEAGWLADPQPGDEEAARLWWYWSPDVPTELRRVLDARVIERAGVRANFNPYHDELGRFAEGDGQSASDPGVYYRGEFTKVAEKLQAGGLKGKEFNGRPKSVYMTTNELDAHLYGVQKSSGKTGWSYAVVAVKVPADKIGKIVADERDTKEVYGRKNAVRYPGSIPASWVVSIKHYRIPMDKVEGWSEEDVAKYMAHGYKNNAADGALYYVPILIIATEQADANP